MEEVFSQKWINGQLVNINNFLTTYPKDTILEEFGVNSNYYAFYCRIKFNGLNKIECAMRQGYIGKLAYVNKRDIDSKKFDCLINEFLTK